MSHGKSATFVVLDVSASMGPHLADAKRALSALITNKILFSTQDGVGLALAGTEETDNAVNEEMGEGQYEHISVTQPMGKAAFSHITALDGAQCEGAQADLIDGLVVAMDAVCKYVKALKFNKRIVVVTDGGSFPAGDDDEGTAEILDNIVKEGIHVTVLGIGLAGEVKPEGGATTSREHFVQFLGRLRARAEDHIAVRELSEELERHGGISGKDTKATKAFQGALRIGAASLPVHCWRRVAKGQPPKLFTVSKAALTKEGIDPKGTVMSERRYFVNSIDDEEDVPPDERLNAYKYGKDLVTCNQQDEENMKFGVLDKDLQLVGMVPQADVPRQWFMHNSQCMVGASDAPYAHAALSALALAMEEEGLVGIARYAQRKGANPRLYCLTPGVRCVFLNALPFGDELRRMEWPPPPKDGVTSATAAQQAAADALVDALDLCNPAVAPAEPSPGKGKHALRPKDLVNPTLQRAYQAILHKALNPSAGLPAPDWRVMQPLRPDGALFSHAKPALEAFERACPTEKAEKDEKKPTKRQYGAGAKASEEPPAKQMRSEGGAASRATLELKASKVQNIDTGKPVESFWAMLRDEEQDRLVEAFTQLEEVLVKLLGQAPSHDDASAQKAFTCLREFRRAAVQEEEPGHFNKLLETLKARYMGPGGKTEFWAAIINDEGLQPGLITSDETEESSVSRAEAESFFAVDTSAPTQTMAVETEQADEDDEYGGLD